MEKVTALTIEDALIPNILMPGLMTLLLIQWSVQLSIFCLRQESTVISKLLSQTWLSLLH